VPVEDVRPWKRGSMGRFAPFFCSGYCSVVTFLNIVAKVTPNPLTGSRSPLRGVSSAT
jgi:hypothetical protein